MYPSTFFFLTINQIYLHVFHFTVSADESILGKQVELTEEKVLELIESAYPNPITAEDIAR